MSASEQILETIRAELESCEADARRHGWDGEEWEPTHEDLISVAAAVARVHGRRPTREEWAEAGITARHPDYLAEVRS